MKLHIPMSVLCLVLLTACGGSDTPEGAAKSADKAAKKASKDAPAACDLVDAAMIKTGLAIAGEVTKDADQYGNSCSFTWQFPDTEAREEAFSKAIMERAKKVMAARESGEEVPPMPMPVTEGSLFLNLTAMADTQAATSLFASNIKTLREGVTGQTDEVKATFKIDYNKLVEGVGNQAAWSDKQRQLYVQQDNLFLYLTLQNGGSAEEDLASAKQLMAEVLKKL